MSINILIIGTGNFGRRYIEIIKKKFYNINLTVFDKDYKKANILKKKYPKLNILKKIGNLSNIKAVIICTPANTHNIYAAKCIENNIPFLCEKPIDTNYKKWLTLNKKIKKNKLICGIAYPRRYLDVVNYVKKILQNNSLGNLILVQSNFSQDFRKYRPDYLKSYYPYKERGGGIILDALSHHLNLVTFFCGNLFKLKKISEKKIIKNINGHDYAVLILSFKNNVSGLIVGNQFQKPNYDKIEFIFTRGNLLFDRISGKLEIMKNDKSKKIKYYFETWENLLIKQIKSFIKSIKQNKNYLLTSIEEDIQNIKLLTK